MSNPKHRCTSDPCDTCGPSPAMSFVLNVGQDASHFVAADTKQAREHLRKAEAALARGEYAQASNLALWAHQLWDEGCAELDAEEVERMDAIRLGEAG